MRSYRVTTPGGYVDQMMPFSGSTPLSRHCSALGAQQALPRASRQTLRYFALLFARGETGLTDWEARALLGLERSTVNARRVPWCAPHLVEPWIAASLWRTGPTGIKNTVWVLTDVGRSAVQAMFQSEAQCQQR